MMKQTLKPMHARYNKPPHVHLRIRVFLCQQEPIISHFISCYGLSVNVTRDILKEQIFPKQLDLELHGTITQVQQGLAYLAAVSLAIQGKPNVDGDSWHY